VSRWLTVCLLVAMCVQIIRTAFAADKCFCTKATFADLVTETDRYIESLIIHRLKDKYPLHRLHVTTTTTTTTTTATLSQ